MANLPDFQRMKIEGGGSKYKQPVLPGEQRLVPGMREQVPPSLPPVRQATADPREFLDAFLALYTGGGQGAVSPDLAKSLAAVEYLNRDRSPDFNPSIAASAITSRGADILRNM